jgi:hypothetical protein
MCQICHNPRSKAQARAKERILKKEREKILKRIKNIFKLLSRMQLSPCNYRYYARSKHTGTYIDNWNSKLDGTPSFVNISPEHSEHFLREDNLFCYSRERKFLFFPKSSFKYRQEGKEKFQSIIKIDGAIVYNPSEEDLKSLRRIGEEVLI